MKWRAGAEHDVACRWSRTYDDAQHRDAKRNKDPEKLVVELAHGKIVLAPLRGGCLYRQALTKDDADAANGCHIQRQRQCGDCTNVKDRLANAPPCGLIMILGEFELDDAREREAGDERRRC